MHPLHETDPTDMGRYRLAGRLGAGGMGDVYLGRTPGGRPAAVKVISAQFQSDPQALSRFRREVETLRTVHSAYTAALIDAEVTTPPYWMATEYIPGPTLADAVRNTGPLPPQLCRALLAALAEGLTDIHVRGVLHRDIKPQNVILSATGPQLIDFGIARGFEPSDLTQAGVAIGTPGFIAPETITESVTGPAADVFALGATLAHALTGRPPYGEGSMMTVAYRTVHEEVDLRGVPADIAELVASCTHRDPGRRPDPQRIVDLCGTGTDLVQLPAYRRAAATTAPVAAPPAAAAPEATAPAAEQATAVSQAATALVAAPAPTAAATVFAPGAAQAPPATMLDSAGPAPAGTVASAGSAASVTAEPVTAATAAAKSGWRDPRRLALGAVLTAGAVTATVFGFWGSGDGKESEAGERPSSNQSRSEGRPLPPEDGGDPPSEQPGEAGSDNPAAPDEPVQDAPEAPPESLVVPAGLTLKIGEFIQAARAKLIMDQDGNLVLLDENGEARWSNQQPGPDFITTFQTDGNLVVYDAAHQARWASRTDGAEGAVLELRADGNMVITKDGQDLWQTDTAH
ncbi:protein kinase domain-containing protein [Streptomyces paludis]|uniref:Serine/threonine protein kinase n=1 Tax=Streptomyces paludis TaxID=2282738 RepID=A0A345HYE7_9ACTN|nr:protein kinase [Streptomyces paludis]AXG81721.1 serine/threonine protein kinase [Streptomyces paludis]